MSEFNTAWNVAQYEVFSGPYFPVFGRFFTQCQFSKLRNIVELFSIIEKCTRKCKTIHCLKSVRIRSFSGLYFQYSVRMLENTVQKSSEYAHFSRSNIWANSRQWMTLLRKLLFLKATALFRLLSKICGDTFCENSWRLLLHYVKSDRIQSYSGPYFPSFGLNTERCSVSLRGQSKCEKIRTRITPSTDTFYNVPVMLLAKHSIIDVWHSP